MGNLRFFNATWWCLLLVCTIVDKVYCDISYDPEITETLRILLNPQENDSIQVQALRRQLLRILLDDISMQELGDANNYNSEMAWNDLLDEHKRNLEALARAGTWYKNPPEVSQTEDPNYKRSIAYLAKNGQPPLIPLPLENQKRGIEALARNGDLHRRQSYQDFKALLEALYDKRNVASLARNYNYPTTSYGKRSISSLAKSGELPYPYGKRNIQSLARDGVLGKKASDYVDMHDKRNIQSIKAQQRNKRQADYFNNEIVYHIPSDYEDVLQDLESAAQDVYPVEDKRFLGSVAKTGWFRSTNQDSSLMPSKRHVAALARLGWLPTYRSSRRFNRSGRSNVQDLEDVPEDETKSCRENPTDGKTKDYSYSKVSSLPLDTKRYLLQPAVDNILLRKAFRHPRMII